MSTNKKIISVFGATGAQGGGVVQVLLKNDKYQVRALTRNPNSEQALKLKEQGAEVVKCDDADSKEAIKEAIKGSYGVFSVTNWWAYFEKEYEYGLNIVHAALESGVKHFVFSGLTPMKKISGGRFDVPFFDIKFEIEQYIRNLSKENPEFVSSFVYAPPYLQNFHTLYKPKKNENDEGYTIYLPADPSANPPLSYGDISELGYVVEAELEDPTKYSGLNVPFSGSTLNGHQVADIFSKHTGKTVKFQYITPEDYKKTYVFPGSDGLADMFSFYNEFGCFQNLDETLSKDIRKFTTLEEYLKKVDFKLE